MFPMESQIQFWAAILETIGTLRSRQICSQMKPYLDYRGSWLLSKQIKYNGGLQGSNDYDHKFCIHIMQNFFNKVFETGHIGSLGQARFVTNYSKTLTYDVYYKHYRGIEIFHIATWQVATEAELDVLHDKWAEYLKSDAELAN